RFVHWFAACSVVLPLYIFLFLRGLARAEIDTLPLHDALPISERIVVLGGGGGRVDHLLANAALLAADRYADVDLVAHLGGATVRSEEHTSELQSRENLVCRLLLEKKKTNSLYCDATQHRACVW